MDFNSLEILILVNVNIFVGVASPLTSFLLCLTLFLSSPCLNSLMKNRSLKAIETRALLRVLIVIVRFLSETHKG